MFEQSPRADERKFDAPSARSRPPSKIKTRFTPLLPPSACTSSTIGNLNKLSAPVRPRRKEFSSGIRIGNSRAISSSDLRFRKCNCSMDSSMLRRENIPEKVEAAASVSSTREEMTGYYGLHQFSRVL